MTSMGAQVRVAFISDAWKPQLNGVVRVLSMLMEKLTDIGYDPILFTPQSYRTIPCPTYPEIRLSIGAGRYLERELMALQPDTIHIATEGPLGLSARSICIRNGWRFTTAFHTKFPDYIYARCRLPISWTYAALRRFHSRSSSVIVATETIRRELLTRGFKNIAVCTPGVDAQFFRQRQTHSVQLPRPIFLYVGRIAIEKNIPAFLNLKLPGSKLVVGNGPLLEKYRRIYPDVHFVGAREGEDLLKYYSAADVLVLPSWTETFGLVLLEALACGIPIAAYPCPGPMNVIGTSNAGVLDLDLRKAALEALSIPRYYCRAHAIKFPWERTAQQFASYLVGR